LEKNGVLGQKLEYDNDICNHRPLVVILNGKKEASRILGILSSYPLKICILNKRCI